MNTTSRAILQTVLATDASLSPVERGVIQQAIDGLIGVASATSATEERLLITQKEAAKLLSVSRVTVWRLTRDCALHPVEILPGTWRYSWHEVAALAKTGWRGITATVGSAGPHAMSA